VINEIWHASGGPTTTRDKALATYCDIVINRAVLLCRRQAFAQKSVEVFDPATPGKSL
jgi:hypothetical protein